MKKVKNNARHDVRKKEIFKRQSDKSKIILKIITLNSKQKSKKKESKELYCMTDVVLHSKESFTDICKIEIDTDRTIEKASSIQEHFLLI